MNKIRNLIGKKSIEKRKKEVKKMKKYILIVMLAFSLLMLAQNAIADVELPYAENFRVEVTGDEAYLPVDGGEQYISNGNFCVDITMTNNSNEPIYGIGNLTYQVSARPVGEEVASYGYSVRSVPMVFYPDSVEGNSKVVIESFIVSCWTVIESTDGDIISEIIKPADDVVILVRGLYDDEELIFASSTHIRRKPLHYDTDENTGILLDDDTNENTGIPVELDAGGKTRNLPPNVVFSNFPEGLSPDRD